MKARNSVVNKTAMIACPSLLVGAHAIGSIPAAVGSKAGNTICRGGFSSLSSFRASTAPPAAEDGAIRVSG